MQFPHPAFCLGGDFFNVNSMNKFYSPNGEHRQTAKRICRTVQKRFPQEIGQCILIERMFLFGNKKPVQADRLYRFLFFTAQKELAYSASSSSSASSSVSSSRARIEMLIRLFSMSMSMILTLTTSPTATMSFTFSTRLSAS